MPANRFIADLMPFAEVAGFRINRGHGQSRFLPGLKSAGQVAGEVHAGISRIARQAEGEGTTHPDILKGLGEVYAQTLSPMKPKVMVQGSPHYLGQPQVVGEIRALLLSAVRSAVLWRQMGGSQWALLLKRGEMKRAAHALLATT